MHALARSPVAAAPASRTAVRIRPAAPVSNRQLARLADRRRVLARSRTAVEIEQDETVSSDDKAVGLAHTRSAPHAAAVNEMWQASPWASVPNGAVANHSISYARLLAGIQDFFFDETLEDATTKLHTAYAFTATNFGRDANAENVINQFGSGQAVDVDRAELNGALNYYVYKVCDMPGNLFYWPPAHTSGGDPDVPNAIPGGNPPPGWVPMGGADMTGATERNRLSQAATALGQVQLD